MKDRKLAQEVKDLIEITEMAYLDQQDTGIPKIWLQAYAQADKAVGHGPRIKVSNNYGKFRDDYFCISLKTFDVVEGEVKLKPKELQKVIEWMKLNQKVLREYWKKDGKLVTRVFLNSLIKLED